MGFTQCTNTCDMSSHVQARPHKAEQSNELGSCKERGTGLNMKTSVLYIDAKKRNVKLRRSDVCSNQHFILLGLVMKFDNVRQYLRDVKIKKRESQESENSPISWGRSRHVSETGSRHAYEPRWQFEMEQPTKSLVTSGLICMMRLEFDFSPSI